MDEESDIYKELTKYLCPTFEDAQAKALAQIRLEEDMQSRKAYNNVDSRKSAPTKQSSWRPKPYDNPQQVHSVRQSGSPNDWKNNPGLPPPKLTKYGFSVDVSGIVNTLHSLGNGVKWPFGNYISAPHRDKTKLCEFHGDHGHDTEECVALI